MLPATSGESYVVLVGFCLGLIDIFSLHSHAVRSKIEKASITVRAQKENVAGLHSCV